MKKRVPVDHPEYEYLPSRNPYSDKIKDLGFPGTADGEAEKYRGRWRELFPEKNLDSPLHVEIGCNGGHVLLEWAKSNPTHRYVGLDWKYKQIYRAFEKAAKHKIRNAIFIRALAERIHYIFAPGEIDHLYLFFPDPWPKKSQAKHRVFQEKWLRNAATMVRSGGTFWIKTDHDGYFEWMKEILKKVSDQWTLIENTADLHSAVAQPLQLKIPEVTLFERIWIRDGIKIKSLRLRRNG